jgi:arginyl-tRNA synthetase
VTTAPLAELREAVERAAATIAPPRARPTLERSKQAAHGDYSTNAAMLLAPAAGAPPREVAERLGAELASALGPALDRYEIAGPGFLNLFLSDEWHRRSLAHVLGARDAWGGGGAAVAERVNVEFVSANPTGPMHVGHARNAAYGDALSRILALQGHEVTREFYVNDYGSQIANLAASIQARARREEVPADGYRGDYVIDLAREIPGAADSPLEEVARAGVAAMVSHMRETLHSFGVDFDLWFSERSLHEGAPDPVRHAFDVLEEQGRTYRHEGALWLRTTAFGDDKDRVLERSSGQHTYFASDIAYHQEKRERGFDRLIDVWGADHHGYVQRMKAAYEALGGDPERLELLIMQLVHLVERGERAQMSKRSGEFVTLDELIEEIGADAARWYLLQRSHETTMDLDLDLARQQSNENPVYYVQYAHARIASMLNRAGEERVARAVAEALDANQPLDPSESALIKKLLAFPAEVDEAAERRAPHRIAAYALELAQDFTAFYRDCRVLGAAGEGVESWRIAVCVASQQTIAQALRLLGVTAPASM